MTRFATTATLTLNLFLHLIHLLFQHLFYLLQRYFEILNLLNTKVATSLFTPELENATTIVKLNALRHFINHVKLEHFARSRSQRIYIFPAQHSRVTSVSSSNLRIEDLLQQTDDSTKVPFQGFFFYTQKALAIILANICMLLGQVNGMQGRASGIVIDLAGTYFHGRSFDK